MKLTEISFQKLNQDACHTLGRLSPGINFIYGEKGAGKSRLCRFIRDLIFGTFDNTPLSVGSHKGEVPVGRIGLSRGDFEFQLRRDFANGGSLEMVDPDGIAITEHDIDTLVSGWLTVHSESSRSSAKPVVDSRTYDLIFSFSLSQTSANLPKLIEFLRMRLNVSVGGCALGEEASNLAWQRATQERASRLAELSKRIEQHKLERLSLTQRLDQDRLSDQARLVQIDLELQQIAVQLNEAEAVAKRKRLVEIDVERVRLKESIEAVIQCNRLQPAQTLPRQDAELQSLLYVRLDDLDQQIHYWRQIQSQIQSRRVNLKQEMDQWNEFDLESPNHPYHHAQKLLTSIENRVNQNDQLARQWELNPAHHTDPSVTVRNIQTLCQSIREDLHNLGQELGSQFKHIRHRAAAIELKHLREMYEDVSQYLDRLFRLKEKAIAHLRQFDAAGGDAIIRAEASFLDLAGQFGYLEARRRTIGPWPVVPVETVGIDVTPLRNRQQLLDNERDGLHRWLAEFDSKRAGILVRQGQLADERRSVETRIGNHRNAEIEKIDIVLAKQTEEYEALLRAVEQDRHYVRPEAHPVLVRASQLLQIGSDGQLQKVWLDSNSQHSSVVVIDRNGRVILTQELQRYQQDLVYLALAMSAKEWMRNQQLDFPALIDDPFVHFSRDRVQPLIALLNELQQAKHQLLLFTNQQYLADRIPGSPVFDLPVPVIVPQSPLPVTDIYRREGANQSVMTSIAPSPAVVSLETFAPNPPAAPPIYVAQRFSEEEFYEGLGRESHTDSQQNMEMYPLSKYDPVDNSIDHRDFIVSYPISSEDIRPISQFEESRSIPFRSEHRQSVSNRPRSNQTDSSRTVARATPVAVEAIGDALGFAPTVDDLTTLDSLVLFQAEELRGLGELQIETVQHLLEIDPDDLSGKIREQGFSSEQIDRWQSIVWLLCNVPGMRPEDAKTLVACGVTEPEHLATSQPQVLLERLQRYLNSRRNPDLSNNRISIVRIDSWMRALQSTRGRWQRSDGLSRMFRRRRPRIRSNRSLGDIDRRESRMIRSQYPQPRSQDRPEVQREPREVRPPRMRTPEKRLESGLVRTNERANPVSKATPKESGKNRFYLELKDHIQSAPSIGPKTAERFERIGVQSVADFLNQTAESMAAKLKYRRITPDVIRSWQDQTRLVCRIPNLRGHDAQLLVACDFIEPEKIAAMHPQKLLDIILPFSRTKEGLKIIRTGREPDLEEVTNWIRWASMTRSLHAA